MFRLLVHVEVRPEWLDRFRTAIRQNAETSVVRDPGCVRFEVSVVSDERTKFVFYEVYTSEEAWQAHRESAHFREYQEVAAKALLSRTLTRLEPL